MKLWERAQRNTRLVRSTVQHWMRRFFPAVCDSFALCLLFLLLRCFIYFFFVLRSVVFLVGGRRYTNTRTAGAEERGKEIHGLQFFSASSQFLLPLNFRFFNFFSLLFFCLFMCILSSNTLLTMRCHNADLKHLFCIFVMCVYSLALDFAFLTFFRFDLELFMKWILFETQFDFNRNLFTFPSLTFVDLFHQIFP